MSFENIVLTPGVHDYCEFPIEINYSVTSNSIMSINTVNIDINHRGKGLFKSLLDYFKSKFTLIRLESWSTLVPMYKHLGFIDEGVDDQNYHEMIWRNDPDYYKDHCISMITSESDIKYPIMEINVFNKKFVIRYYSEKSKELRTLILKDYEFIINNHYEDRKRLSLLDGHVPNPLGKHVYPDLMIKFDKLILEI